MSFSKSLHHPENPLEKMDYRIEFHSEISQIPAEKWNALVENNHTFVKYEFLNALEKHHCVSPKYGWVPHHLAIYDHHYDLIAAMPLYEKHNNYGEFVFDQAWEKAWNSLACCSGVIPMPVSRTENCRVTLSSDLFDILVVTTISPFSAVVPQVSTRRSTPA